MNKPIYLGLSTLEINKIVMHGFWYDYEKPKYGEKAKLCCMGTDSSILYIKTEDIYSDIVKDVETIIYNSNYELDRSLPKGKSKKVIGLVKDELNGKMMKEFATLAYSYLTDKNNEDKRVKGTKKCAVKRKFKFEDNKH